jgi:hypothetical protein
MRTIKFRGKCAKDSRYKGEWVYGGLLQCEKSDDVLIVYSITDTCSCTYHVDPATVGQFTGRYDKKGNEIYDGDILQDDDKRRYQVTWDIQLSRWSLVYGSGYYSMTEVEIHFQVIGNIHDNPELLKGGK